jgi:signal transduction histidine kinase
MTADIRTHDIENQLAVIQGFAELLLADAAADDPRRDDFDRIRDAALTARRLLAGGTAAEAGRDAAAATCSRSL